MKENLYKSFYLQLFAEDVDTGAEKAGSEDTAEKPTDDKEPNENPATQLKYSDEDVNRMFNKKFAEKMSEWQKEQEKKTSEAERLGRMTAEEKANERIKVLEEKLAAADREKAVTAMAKQARTMLQDKNINVSDELLANLISDDADSTKASVESFIALFQGAVEKAVKDAYKGETPRKGGVASLTKEQIMAVQNRAERQRLISENMHLFNK